MAVVYSLDFLQQVINCNWNDGYLVLAVNATALVNGDTPPPCPAVTLDLDPSQKLVDSTNKCSHAVNPPLQTFKYFIWNTSLLPFPTGDDFTPIGAGVTYAGQLAQLVDPAFGGFRSPGQFGVPGGPDFTDGSFATFERAEAYAAAWNTRFAGINGGPDYFGTASAFFGEHGGIVNATFTPAVAQQLLVDTDNGSATSVTQAAYLIKTPNALTKFSVSVSSVGGPTFITLSGYHGALPKTVGAVTATPDSGAGVQAIGSLSANGTAQITISPTTKQDFNTVTLETG
jgi:hypothetical protein